MPNGLLNGLALYYKLLDGTASAGGLNLTGNIGSWVFTGIGAPVSGEGSGLSAGNVSLYSAGSATIENWNRDYTTSQWGYYSGVNGQQTIFTVGEGDTSGWDTTIGKVTATFDGYAEIPGSDSSYPICIVPVDTLSVGWHNIISRWTAATKTMEVFIDGLLVTTTIFPVGQGANDPTNSVSVSGSTGFPIGSCAAWFVKLTDAQILLVGTGTPFSAFDSGSGGGISFLVRGFQQLTAGLTK